MQPVNESAFAQLVLHVNLLVNIFYNYLFSPSVYDVMIVVSSTVVVQ